MGSANDFAFAVASADFNRDGKPDLAYTSVDSRADTPDIRAFLGRGDGTFRHGRAYKTGNTAVALATGDFNRDHRPDIAVRTRTARMSPS